MSKANVSEGWTYFTIYDAETVKNCVAKILAKRNSAMRNHLEAKHKNEYERYEKIKRVVLLISIFCSPLPDNVPKST